jgi:beta-glucanase (GH16 family)
MVHLLRRLVLPLLRTCLALTIAAPLRAEDVGPFGRSGNWIRVFTDDFNGQSLDRSHWTTCFWWGREGCTNRGNNDLEWYLPTNIAVTDGALELIAKPERITAPDGAQFEYTSGMVTTGSYYATPEIPPLFQTVYGFFEIRAKLPSGRGIFPGFWLEAGHYQNLPEIDVVETIGQEPNLITNNFHYRGNGGMVVAIGHRTKTVDLTQDWHVYGLQWRPDALIWYLDGIELWRFTKKEFIPSTPMYLLLTLSVGGNWPGKPDATTSFPVKLLVDYVRVWQAAQ